MNKTAIKNYSVWARNELIDQVTRKAFEYEVKKDIKSDEKKYISQSSSKSIYLLILRPFLHTKILDTINIPLFIQFIYFLV